MFLTIETVQGVHLLVSLEEKRGEEDSFIKERGKLGGAVINKDSSGGNWEFQVK